MEINKRKKLRMNKKGSEDSFKATLVGLVMFVAFTWIIITVAVNFGNTYGKDANEIGNGSLNLNYYQEAVQNTSTNAEIYRTNLENADLKDIDSAVGIFSIAIRMVNLVTSPFKLVGQILLNLGIPSLLISFVLGLLAISIIFGIWRLLRAGS